MNIAATFHDTSPMTASELSRFWHHLQQPVALTEIAILLACLGLAWLIVRLWRGRQGDVRSIWLGHHIIDGALFPVLSLGLALLAYRLFQGVLPMLVFQVALPVLTSLAVIRMTVKVLRAAGGREAIVPNEMLITQRVENASLSDRRVSVSTVVQVAYGTDLKALFPELLAGIAEVDRVLSDPAPSVLLSNFAADGLELTLFFWVRDPEQGIGRPRSNVNLLVLDTLNRLGIEIPFTQRVVHQLPPAPVHEVSSGAP